MPGASRQRTIGIDREGGVSEQGCRFRQDLQDAFQAFVTCQSHRFPSHSTVRIDLHCHDFNSSVPDELLGRILRWPETWTRSESLLDTLKRNGAQAFTITNHNNARSCFDLLDKGIDLLVGAEFTCLIPAFDVSIHVLTYGFDPGQEVQLNRLRGDLPRFLDYTLDQNLVTVLAHPLFVHGKARHDPVELMQYLTLMFDRFEVINGQRDTWQNLVAASWLEHLTEERIESFARRFGIRPDRYCSHGWVKTMTGGSDDHMALFAGQTGTILHLPEGMQASVPPASSTVLEALRSGRCAPYGTYVSVDKLASALLDYFCQIVMHAEDPGLVRMLLHQGTTRQKIWAFLIANGAFELRRHRFTLNFIRAAHEALQGKKPGFIQRHMVSRTFRPLISELDTIARIRTEYPELLGLQLRQTLPAIFHTLLKILAERIEEKVTRSRQSDGAEKGINIRKLIAGFEIPVDFRRLVGESTDPVEDDSIPCFDLKALSDGLPFPALAALLIGSSAYAGARVNFSNRSTTEAIADQIGMHRHPKRALWLTDTFYDQNGVGTTLQLIHSEIIRDDLPIDFVICHPTASNDSHLHVLRPVYEFTPPFYSQQPVRVFDLIELQRLFIEGGYDRIICSTELLMGAAALYLGSAFSVPTWFYVHTDWLDFVRNNIDLDIHQIDRVRRILRTFYSAFDGLLILNSEQIEWFSSEAMNIPRYRLHATSHWVHSCFGVREESRADVLPGIDSGVPLLIYAGRISDEKGVWLLPEILDEVRQQVGNATLLIVGDGPGAHELKRAIPDARFKPWLPREQLASLFNVCDLLLFPSRFDTFGNVVLEALSCGLPSVAFNTKGPRDIIWHGECGYLVETPREMIDTIIRHILDPEARKRFREGAIQRARDFSAPSIMRDLLATFALDSPCLSSARPAYHPAADQHRHDRDQDCHARRTLCGNR